MRPTVPANDICHMTDPRPLEIDRVSPCFPLSRRPLRPALFCRGTQRTATADHDAPARLTSDVRALQRSTHLEPHRLPVDEARAGAFEHVSQYLLMHHDEALATVLKRLEGF